MAKRFIASEIWDKDWFLDLPSKYKILWFYLCTKCDVAGVFDPNLKTVSKILGEKFYEEEVLKVFQGKVHKVKDKWVLDKFIKFQYGDTISPKMIPPITAALIKIGLRIDTVSIGYPYSIDTPIDIEKDIDKEIDKDNNDNKVLINNDNKVFNNDNGKKLLYLEKVLLSKDEYARLVSRFGEQDTQDKIARLNDYGHQFPKKFREYGSHYHTILAWARKDPVVKDPKKPDPLAIRGQEVLKKVKQWEKEQKQ